MQVAFRVEPMGPDALRIVGDFDVAQVAVYDDAVTPLLATANGRLTIDLSAVTFLASAGLSCLIRTHHAHPNLVLRAPTAAVLRILEIAGMDAVFRIEAEAGIRDSA
jgi:anti-anti-sigma factor